ncbi:MAG TPA: DUF1254 domain-containing protein [Sphingobium sp.]|uniref:DUF1254 domain-containing protein n=1 Tax=Sphingobium sp. TaxID=1912891 RepID=UPI002ED405EF
MPAVNFDLLLQGFIQAGGGPNQVPYWSCLGDWKNQTLTPNPDTIYFNPYFDTKNGPIVLEIPPAGEDASITGSIDTCWQAALEDVGPAGIDKGAGGKYLILPPGHSDAVPDGYIAIPSVNFQGFVILRSNVKSGSDEDVAAAVAYGKRIRLYPLAEADASPETRFVDLAGVLYDSTIRYDHSFFASLARIVEYEPWLERDRTMIDSLRSLGIAKGQPFAPDATMRNLLDAAIREAHAWLDLQCERIFDARFFADSRWLLPAYPELVKAFTTGFADPDSYPVDARGVAYTMAYFSARHLGAGQYYLMTIADSDGAPLNGAASYRLHVPPDAPVDLYWSVTAYNRETHALIREVDHASRASTTPGIETNADGSVDIWFAPAPPEGKAVNWVPTRADQRFELLFRLYGVRKSFFEKSWTLPDIEKIR